MTEGHYDASFETDDPAASFDVEPANYESYEACAYVEEPTILSNGHYKMSCQELNMLGMNQPTTTTSSAKSSLETSKHTKVSSAAPLSDPVVGPPVGTKTQDGRKVLERGGGGELNIQSIPSELELVQEKDLSEGGGGGSLVTQQGDQGGNTMLWKRVRHCVVFGGKIIKPKKEKD